MKLKCPVCGDPGPFVLWSSSDGPVECPYNPAAKSVTDCRYQMEKAWQSAEFRKLVPDAFYEDGSLKPGRGEEVLRAFVGKHPDKAIRLG